MNNDLVIVGVLSFYLGVCLGFILRKLINLLRRKKRHDLVFTCIEALEEVEL